MPCCSELSTIEPLHLGIAHRCARSRLVAVVARPVFWPKRPCLAQRIGDRRRACRCALRIRQPISSPARSLIANGPIGKPNSVIAASTSCGSAPSSSSRSASRAALRQHAVADETVADADDDRHLADLRPSAIAVASTSGAVSFAAHDFQQPHHVRRAEEMHARARRRAASWQRRSR